MTINERLETMQLIKNAIEKDTVINSSYCTINNIAEEKELSRKKFWAYGFNPNEDIKLKSLAAIKNIKTHINDFILENPPANNFVFDYTVAKCETLTDKETGRKLMRGIIFYEISEVKGE